MLYICYIFAPIMTKKYFITEEQLAEIEALRKEFINIADVLEEAGNRKLPRQQTGFMCGKIYSYARKSSVKTYDLITNISNQEIDIIDDNK